MGLSLDLYRCCCPVEESTVLFMKSKLSLCKVERLQNSPGERRWGIQSNPSHETPMASLLQAPSGFSMTLSHYFLKVWDVECPVSSLTHKGVLGAGPRGVGLQFGLSLVDV